MYLNQRTAGPPTQTLAYNGSTVPLSPEGIAVVVTNGVFVLLVTIWTGLRFYSRKTMGHGLMIEDYFHLCAVVQIMELLA